MGNVNDKPLLRHGRARPGHPRLVSLRDQKTWMPGTRVYTWARQRRDPSAGHDGNVVMLDYEDERTGASGPSVETRTDCA
jgi:hypothetical protein